MSKQQYNQLGSENSPSLKKSGNDEISNNQRRIGRRNIEQFRSRYESFKNFGSVPRTRGNSSRRTVRQTSNRKLRVKVIRPKSNEPVIQESDIDEEYRHLYEDEYWNNHSSNRRSSKIVSEDKENQKQKRDGYYSVGAEWRKKLKKESLMQKSAQIATQKKVLIEKKKKCENEGSLSMGVKKIGLNVMWERGCKSKLCIYCMNIQIEMMQQVMNEVVSERDSLSSVLRVMHTEKISLLKRNEVMEVRLKEEKIKRERENIKREKESIVNKILTTQVIERLSLNLLEKRLENNQNSTSRLRVEEREIEKKILKIRKEILNNCEKAICSLCCDKMRNVAFNCGHTFCVDCAINVQKSSTKQCPICRVNIKGLVHLK